MNNKTNGTSAEQRTNGIFEDGRIRRYILQAGLYFVPRLAPIPGVDQPLWEYVVTRDRDGFRKALNQLVRDGCASAEDIETLMRVASRSCGKEPPTVTTETLAVGYFLSGYDWSLPPQARFALAALGRGGEPEVIDWIISGARRYSARGAYTEGPADFLLLIALDHEATLPAIEEFLEMSPFWSIRIACLYRMPASRTDGNLEVIRAFIQWILNAPSGRRCDEAWRNWEGFAACLTLDGIRSHYGRGAQPFPVPMDGGGRLLTDWALEEGRVDWLMQELRWLHRHGSFERFALRNRLVAKGIPSALEFACEEIRNAAPEDYTHFDVVHNALRFHPRPLPQIALDACVEVIRHPSHPSAFGHRIEALHLLIEAADQGNYSRESVSGFILEMAQSERDPDVRAAVIPLLHWARPADIRAVLAAALDHDSSRVRDAAKKVLAEYVV